MIYLLSDLDQNAEFARKRKVGIGRLPRSPLARKQIQRAGKKANADALRSAAVAGGSIAGLEAGGRIAKRLGAGRASLAGIGLQVAGGLAGGAAVKGIGRLAGAARGRSRRNGKRNRRRR